MTPLTTSPQGAVVSHQNVTDRKRVEFELARLPPPTPSPVSPIAATSWRRHRREVERVRRFDVPASVVMMDLDHFKAVNDTYGHAVGDEVLRLVAVTAKGCLRDIDVLARLGGGGVCPASTGTSWKGAEIVAERLRGTLVERPVQDAFVISASFGVSEVETGDLSIDDGFRGRTPHCMQPNIWGETAWSRARIC